MSADPISYKVTTTPVASEVVILMDSTRWPSGPVSFASQHATTGTYLTPGSDRGFLKRAVVSVSIKAAAQAVTLTYDILTGNAGTKDDWENQGGAGVGSITVASGTTYTGEFKPMAADFRVKVTAGGVAPDSLICQVQFISPTTDYGN